MPTHAWAGFIHSWHTLGIVLKWMCITVVGIPVAFATCVLVGLCALAFAALCIAAAALGCAIVFFIFKGIWIVLSGIPYWIEDWRIRRAERKLLGGIPGLPVTEVRQIPLQARQLEMQDATPRNSVQLVPPGTAITTLGALRLPPPALLPPVSIDIAAGPATSLSGLYECQVCLDEKFRPEFPGRVPTDACEHAATDCCTECLAQAITSAFEGNMWDDIRCPCCNIQLQHRDVAEFANPEIFSRYDYLAMRRAVERDVPNFRWCLGPGCSSGQEHDPSAEVPIVICDACGFTSCSNHEVRWHEGETCEEYDKKIKASSSLEDKRMEKIIKRIAKRCPGCRRYINKNGGCPHMSCLCGRQWCWNCGHDYPGHSWGCMRRS